MEHEGKKKNPYKGIYIGFIFVILVPIVFYFLFYAVLNRVGNTPIMAVYMSLTFAGLIGVLFDAICIISGLITDLFVNFFRRIKNTLTYFRPFEKGSYSFYFRQFIEGGGPLLWIFLLLFAATAVMAIFGAVNFLSNINL